jgi:hypothetical protein
MPKQVAPTETNGDERFEVRSREAVNDSVLYLIAAGGSTKAKQGGGDNPAVRVLRSRQTPLS